MDQIAIKYDKLIIFYFSGTGNAKNASAWMLAVAESMGLSTELINISKAGIDEIPEIKGNTLIGFCFPTHGFTAPPILLKFIRKFPKGNGSDAFILNTRAGMKMNKLFIPGLSGMAQILPALILVFKRYRIIGMQPLDLPSNWLLLHPGLRKKVIDSIYQRCNRIVEDFALKMLSRRKSFKALVSLPIDIALVPIAIGYFFLGRFFLAKTLIATDDCDLCEQCIKQCPVAAVSLVNGRPFWSYRCESCMKCVNACPKRAIETAHAFAASMILLSSLVLSPLLIYILKDLDLWKFANQSMISRNIWSIIDAFIFLMFVFIFYRILHFLMKFKLINQIIAYTSLSKYKFWRRYKAPSK